MRGRVVILDRDGVINFDSPDYIKSVAEWRPIPGSLEAIARLSAAGASVFVATNQAGIARGKLSSDALADIHAEMIGRLEAVGGSLAGIEFCPHHPDDDCQCRKPAPGMLERIGERSGLPIAGEPFVGDSLKDIEAAEAAGCRPVLVLTGNGETTWHQRSDLVDVYPDLASFVDAWLSETR